MRCGDAIEPHDLAREPQRFAINNRNVPICQQSGARLRGCLGLGAERGNELHQARAANARSDHRAGEK